MKILFLSSRIPYPPDRGDKVRLQLLLQIFQSLGTVTLACMVDSRIDSVSMTAMRKQVRDAYFIEHGFLPRCWNLIANVFRNLPFQVAYYKNPKFEKLLKGIIQDSQFDIIYIHLIRMAPYALIFDPARIILDYTDCISLEYRRSLPHRNLFMKLFFALEAKRTADYEFFLRDKFAENWVISPVDLKAMGMQNHSKSVLVPNSVRSSEIIAAKALHWCLSFSGNMSIPHNISAAVNIFNKIMPALIQRFPNLRLKIIGAAPNHIVKAMQGKNNTEVKGFVPDLYSELKKTDIFIAPMYFSAGVQNKVLEAMACGIPVITTSNLAQSLECQNGVEIVIADTDEDFIRQTIILLQDEAFRGRIGLAGFEFVRARFSQQALTNLITERLIHIVNQVSS